MSKGIWIITEDTPAKGGKDGSIDIGPDFSQPSQESQNGKQRTHIKAEDLKRNMSEFLEVVEEAFDRTDKPKSKIELDELELSVEINGSGQVSLFGTGGQAGAKGGIKLKFKRKQ
ncbi:MAG: hypothetical protein QNJ54_06520 [Prochloraceae cyanobacterium]|nr:hypothetical protein [Prochloraceae cyanobacterium]